MAPNPTPPPSSPRPSPWKALETGYRGYPVGTVAFYGPDDRTVTKVVAAVVLDEEGAVADMRKWFGARLDEDERAARDAASFFGGHPVRSVVCSDGIIGCPHEEGADFPLGGDCPHCPFWAGRQGLRARQGRGREARMVVGFAYFERPQYGRWVAACRDGASWHATWEAWRDDVRRQVSHLRSRGYEVRWRKVDLEAFLAWCDRSGRPPEKASVTAYVTELMVEED